MLFKQIPGHQELKDNFIRQVQGGNIPHAILLLGKEGSEVLPFAIALSQYLLCEAKTEEEACGKCNSCLKISNQVHPDLHFTFPVYSKKSGDKPVSKDFITAWRQALRTTPFMNYYQWMDQIGAENKQGNITAEECAEILRNLNLKAFEGAFKIQLIWMPELLGKEGNRLLKVLEEPTSKTIFILATEDEEKLLNTILSRCQVYKMAPLEMDALRDYLVEQKGINIDQAEKIARIADGSLNQALSLLDDEENLNEQWSLQWFRICFSMYGPKRAQHMGDLIPFSDNLAGQGREKQKSFLKYALYLLRESLQLKYQGQCRLSEGELPFAKHISSKMDSEQIDEMRQIIEQLYFHIERNANFKITFFNQSIRMGKVIAGIPLVY